MIREAASGDGVEATGPINILIALDRNVLWGGAVTVRSAIENSRPGSRFAVHVLHDNLDPQTIDRLRRSWDVQGRATETTFIAAERGTSHGLVRSKTLSHMVYGRLRMGSVLPASVHRCIYMDTDLLFELDIAELFETDLEGNVAAAVPDGSDEWDRSQLHRLGAAGTHFFNSGMLLVDVDLWRRHQVGEAAIEYCRTVHPKLVAPFRMGLYFHDMDAINFVLAGRIKPLPPAWNTWASRLTEYERAVIHLITGPKPWHADYRGIFADRFFDYLDRTAFSGSRPRRLAGMAPVLKRASRIIPYPPTVWRILRLTVEGYRQRRF